MTTRETEIHKRYWDALEDSTMRDDISIEIRSRLNGTIAPKVTPGILFDRSVDFDRQQGGTWVISSIPPGTEHDLDGPVAMITVKDPGIGRFLDSFYRMIANPTEFRNRTFEQEEEASTSPQDAA